jgi:phosphoglycolate phosphatase-like HAD superfamily hydrolase
MREFSRVHAHESDPRARTDSSGLRWTLVPVQRRMVKRGPRDARGQLRRGLDGDREGARTARARHVFSQRAFRATFRLPLPQFFADLGIDDSQCGADEWNEHMGRSAARLMPRACETLEQLRASGLALGVVSAAAAGVVRSQVRKSGLGEYFAFVEAGAPNRRQTLRHLGHLAPGQVAFLGDTEYDIAEARSAGVRAWAFAGGYRAARHLLSAGAERVVGSLAELPDLVLSPPGRVG